MSSKSSSFEAPSIPSTLYMFLFSKYSVFTRVHSFRYFTISLFRYFAISHILLQVPLPLPEHIHLPGCAVNHGGGYIPAMSGIDDNINKFMEPFMN